MTFEPFQNMLPKAANRYGIGNTMKALKICSDFKKLIPDIFDQEKNPEENISPAYYKNATIYINVKNSAWAQEVIIRKEKIIKSLNDKAGKKIIKNLKTQLK